MKVICEQSEICPHAYMCGGAKVHEECHECGRCPKDPDAKCIPIKSE